MKLQHDIIFQLAHTLFTTSGEVKTPYGGVWRKETE